MEKLALSLPIVLPILAMLFVGVFFKKKQIIGESGNATIKKLIVNLMLPAVLIKSFMQAEYNLDVLKVFAIMFAVCTALFFLFRTIKSQPLMQFLMTGFEAGMLGYALFLIIFSNVPNVDISKFAVLDLGQCVFVFTIYTYFVSSDKNRSFKSSMTQMIKSPVIIAIVIGVILGVTKVAEQVAVVNDTLIAVLEFVSMPTACLVLICVGFDLDFSKSVMKQAVIYSVLRVVVMAIVGVLVYFLIGLFCSNGEEFLFPILLMFALPPPYVLPIMQKDENARKVSASTISLSTLIFLAICVAYVIVL